jgi:hypothetical protein
MSRWEIDNSTRRCCSQTQGNSNPIYHHHGQITALYFMMDVLGPRAVDRYLTGQCLGRVQDLALADLDCANPNSSTANNTHPGDSLSSFV